MDSKVKLYLEKANIEPVKESIEHTKIFLINIKKVVEK